MMSDAIFITSFSFFLVVFLFFSQSYFPIGLMMSKQTDLGRPTVIFVSSFISKMMEENERLKRTGKVQKYILEL